MDELQVRGRQGAWLLQALSSEVWCTLLQIGDQLATVTKDGRIVAATCVGFSHMDPHVHVAVAVCVN
jgi:hypothetical protein